MSRLIDRAHHGEPWSPECVDQLTDLIGRGEPVPVIATLLGRSQEAVRSRLVRMGLSKPRKNRSARD
jgi:hypothetical protein